MIKDEKDNTTLPASSNPPIRSEPVVSGDKGAQTLQGTSARSNIFVEYGLLQSLNQSLAASATFSLPCYADPLVRLLLAVLDSLPGDFVKPSMNAAINKMCNALQQADESFDKRHWKFYTNNHNDIPVQGNGHDCGVFVSLYARCLVNKGLMIKQFDIPDFRKSMILELHEKKLNPIPAEPIKPDKYYAVDDINNYYFGRVLEAKSNGFIKFKFWHSAGRNKRDWSRRDDIDEVHVSCIFYGPVHLEGNRPFVITGHEEVEKVFLAAKNVF